MQMKMEEYPTSYVAYARPLILLSGFPGDPSPETPVPEALRNGPRVDAESPTASGHRAEQLHRALRSFEPGNLRKTNLNASMVFRIKSCGRHIRLPCRKASPIASHVSSASVDPAQPSSPTILHSPLSPLSHVSPIYPDGVLTPLWTLKYLELVPSIVLSVFLLGSDPRHDTLRDNQLKSEINAIKAALIESNYGVKQAVIIIGDESTLHSTDVDERLGNIRKSTRLDKSTLFYLGAEVSQGDISAFAEYVLSTLRPACLEFYRNHSKHSRRKKDKGGVPPSSATTTDGIPRYLPRAGWDARYDFKLGFFAEFRLEMDAATRSYTELIDAVMDPNGLFYSMSDWSPRFNELRLLTDVAALRCTRCYLANGLPALACRFWRVYRERVRGMINQKGKGSATYGWKAWEARWAKTMAELIRESYFFATDLNARKSIEEISSKQKGIYARLDKAYLTHDNQAYVPWDCLHHSGYWYSLVASNLAARREFAANIPDDDRVPPGESPATQVARRSELYDTYMCPEPHVEAASVDDGSYYAEQIKDALFNAIEEFSERNQTRMVDRLRIPLAREDIPWSPDQSVRALKSVWMGNKWRRSGWYSLIREVTWALHIAARECQDVSTSVLTIWELLNCRFHPCKGVAYNLEGLLEEASLKYGDHNPRYQLEIRDDEVISFLSLGFCFEKESENLGEPLRAQIHVHSNAQKGSPPITLSSIIVNFDGQTPSINIGHNSEQPVKSDDDDGVIQVEVHETSHSNESNDRPALFGLSSLTFAPHQSRVFTVCLRMSEARRVTAMTAVATIEKPGFLVSFVKDLQYDARNPLWRILRSSKISAKCLRWDAGKINVLPKLPKMKVRVSNLKTSYYTKEEATIQLEIVNEEGEEMEATLGIQAASEDPGAIHVSINGAENAPEEETANTWSVRHPIGWMKPNQVETLSFRILMPPKPTDDLNVDVDVQYHSRDEPERSLSKNTAIKIAVVDPWKPTFAVTPILHPDTWPSYFQIQTSTMNSDQSLPVPTADTATGISSRWSFQIILTSLTAEPIHVDEVELMIRHASNQATCVVLPELAASESTLLEASEQLVRTYAIDLQKFDLDDTRPTIVESSFRVKWRRDEVNTEKTVESMILAPRLNLTISEPRVLATLVRSHDPTIVVIDVTLENPSMHYLSFETGIESSEDFAVSGPKLSTTHLVPISRHTIRFVLLPFVRGTFLEAGVKVVDVYFNKLLRVNAGEGMKSDAAGNLLIWIDES